MIRRKLTSRDRSLAKRMKQLVKQWQRLLQQSASVPNGPAVAASSHALNGVAGTQRVGSTSPVQLSPVGSPRPSPKSSSSSQAVGPPTAATLPAPAGVDPPTPAPTPPPRPADPTAQRMKILHRLSKVKTPPVPTPLPQALLATPARPSLLPTTASNHSVTDSASSSSLHLPPIALNEAMETSTNNSPCPSSLTLSFPLNSQPRRPESRSALELLVKVPKEVLSRVPHDLRLSPEPQPHASPYSLVVSISTSLLHCPLAHPPGTTCSSGPSTMDVDSSSGFAPNSLAELKEEQSHTIPVSAVPGVDGCHGHDGLWYRWTQSIPGEDLSVTVLPYVYIDGIDPAEVCL